MPEISRFLGIVIKMFYDDHNPPHFHVEYNEYLAEINIETLEVSAGNIPARVYSLVLEWASQHRKELMDDWNLAKSNEQPNKIKPLV
ncbi:MAG: DUF4160 domain-containing protein [Ignavibacteriae bacterium]|nr:DUF4160 domain-containing protein [Ignavibacteriota bacterium]